MKNNSKQKRRQSKKVPTKVLLAKVLEHQGEAINGVIAEFEKLKFIALHRMQLNFGLGSPLVRRVVKIEMQLLKFAHEFELQNDVIMENVEKIMKDGSIDDPTLKSFSTAFGSNPAAN
jgi:hypothetical protein